MSGVKVKSLKDKNIEFERLFENYPTRIVIEKMNLTANDYNKLLANTFKRNRANVTPEINMAKTNFPYSRNEDDYGMLNDLNRAIITKHGVFTFENSPITHRGFSELQIEIKNYKQTLNITQ